MKTKNTAPGPDCVTYQQIKTKDPGALILSTIFNLVQLLGFVPEAWRKANIVLAFKAGDTSDIGNWRPIALLNTMGKVFTSCLSDRLNAWANINALISPSQKGFREFEGCLEHNFIVTEVMAEARKRRKEIALAWLDFENAFGAVPHSLIFDSLRALHLPARTFKLVEDLYTNAKCKIRSSTGLSEPIPMEAGVRQGCPLSSLLFNLTIEHFIRQVQESPFEGVRLADQDIKI